MIDPTAFIGPEQLAALKKEAVTAHAAGDEDRALSLYYKALLLAPEDPHLWTNIGAIMRSTKQIASALDAQRKAVALGLDAEGATANLANALQDMGEHAEAAALRRRLLDQAPEDGKRRALCMRSLRGCGRIDEAEALAREVLDQDRCSPFVRMEWGILNLSKGNYAEGFRHYLARRETGDVKLPDLDMPRWTGQALEGKTVLVVPEQGFGDNLCFARFLPYLKQRGATVHLTARRPALRLLAGVEGADRVLPDLDPDTQYDFWTSPMDMPVDYFHFLDEVPPPARIKLVDNAVARARILTAASGDRVKVGVAWHGSEGYERNTMRSAPHSQFRALCDVPGVQLFSLYKGPALEAYYADGTAAHILDACSTDRDLADCAAMIAEMDLVITVDTVTAHIAGALRKPVWNLLHWEAFWLYGPTGNTTPWYPTMTLFRQEKPYDWDPVFRTVLDRLGTFAGDHRNSLKQTVPQ